jgi:hypothetical protein
MGRPRKPTRVLEMSGAFRKDPARGRARANEPRPTTAVGDPPVDFLNSFSPTAKRHLEIWRQFVEQAPEGVLTGCDRQMLANACRLQAQIERGGASAGMYSQMRAYLGEMGMTPASRSKVDAGPKRKTTNDSSAWECLATEAARRRK